MRPPIPNKGGFSNAAPAEGYYTFIIRQHLSVVTTMMISEILLIVAAGLVVAGIGLVRSARAQNRRVWGAHVCPGGGCRHRNAPHAGFCARCGRPL
jgi:hypothetical protein